MVLLLTSLNPKHILMRRFFESQDSLFACANKLVLQIARPFFKILVCLLFCLVISLLMQLSRYNALDFLSVGKSGGLKWTRTIDLALIRRAL